MDMEYKMKRQEIDCLTGKILDIELTPAEIKAYEQKIADDAKIIADADAKKLADAEAKEALLAKLGITSDEAALLLK
jgi:hypothetical protein